MGKGMSFTWNPKFLLRRTEKETMERMTELMQYLEGEAKKKVSRGNKGGDNPSKPFEPPKVVSGTLRSNISYEVYSDTEKVIGALGVKTGQANDYALRLELGFSGSDSKGRKYDQQPRPYLRTTIKENERKIKEVLGKDYTKKGYIK